MAASQTIFVGVGQTLSMVTGAVSYGTFNRQGNPGEGPYTPGYIAPRSTVALGPFATDRSYSVISTVGRIDATVSVVEFPSDVPGDVEQLSTNMTTVPTGRSLVVGATTQSIIFGSLIVTGQVQVAGEMRIGPWPF